MPWGLAAAAVGTVGSLISSDKAKSASDKAVDAQTAAADQTAQLGQDQLAFNKQQYADQKGYRDQASQLAIDGATQQNAQSAQQANIAQDTYNYQKDTYRPLEQQIVSTAQNYDTPERRAAAEQEAAANVEQSYGNAQTGLAQSLARTGVTYGSGRSQSLMQDAALSKAGALASATTGASRNVETVGAAKMADAANLGRNLASNQAAQVNSSINATNSSTAAGSAATNDAAAGVSAVNQGYSGAMSGSLGAGSLYGNAAGIYGNQANASNAALSGIGSAFGNYAGTAAGSQNLNNFGSWMSGLFGGGTDEGADIAASYSDKRMKSDTGKSLSTKKALSGIEKTPIHEGWMYDPVKGGPDDGEQRHDGPMAQDMAKNMGPDVSDGRKYDQISVNGHVMAGMQELAKRMTKLEKRKGV